MNPFSSLGGKAKGTLWFLSFWLFFSTIFYWQRGGLETTIRSNLPTSLGIMQDWQLTEWLAQYIWGPLALIPAFFQKWVRGLRNEKEQPNGLRDDIMQMRAEFQQFRENMIRVDKNFEVLTKIVGIVGTNHGFRVFLNKDQALEVAISQEFNKEETQDASDS